MVPVLNSLGLDAMTAHWQFAYGPETFKQRAAEVSYPMLAINVYDQTTKERLFPPSSVKEIGRLRVGLVGISPPILWARPCRPPSAKEWTSPLGEKNSLRSSTFCALRKR